jgi:DNA polymerase IV
MRIACVFAEYLPAQLEQQRRRLDLPLLITSPIDRSAIYACSAEAAAAGVYPGVSVYQARQIVPEAVLLEPDEHAYHACHSALLAALHTYTPAVETLALGEFLVDVRALLATHGGDAALALALLTAAQNADGLAVRVGLAEGRFVAEQAARAAPPGGLLVVPPGGEAHFLASLPVDVLPNLPGELRRRLHLLDLHTLGDLAALRKAAVMRQFGGDLAGLYELARGRDPRPLHPDAPPLRLIRSLTLTSPVRDRQLLLNGLQRLAWRVAKVLNSRGYHAEALTLTLYLADGRTCEIGQAVKPPTSDEARLSRLAAQLLGKLAVPAPVSALALSIYPLRSWHLDAHQVDLLRAGVNDQQARFENTLHLLVHRFGEAVVRVAALFGPPVPLRIEVALNRQGQPSRLAFGGQERAVAAVHERWLDEGGWWDEARARRRDYYRVTLADGTYRNIYQDTHTRVWYLDRAWPLL